MYLVSIIYIYIDPNQREDIAFPSLFQIMLAILGPRSTKDGAVRPAATDKIVIPTNQVQVKSEKHPNIIAIL